MIINYNISFDFFSEVLNTLYYFLSTFGVIANYVEVVARGSILHSWYYPNVPNTQFREQTLIRFTHIYEMFIYSFRLTYALITIWYEDKPKII